MAKTISITLKDDVAENLELLLQNLTSEKLDSANTFNSHGKLTLNKLAEMLLEDAAMVISRPGSWEGSNMADVLRSHGYTLYLNLEPKIIGETCFPAPSNLPSNNMISSIKEIAREIVSGKSPHSTISYPTACTPYFIDEIEAICKEKDLKLYGIALSGAGLEIYDGREIEKKTFEAFKIAKKHGELKFDQQSIILINEAKLFESKSLKYLADLATKYPILLITIA